MSCPLALSGMSAWASPVTTRGYTIPSSAVVTTVISTATTKLRRISIEPSRQTKKCDDDVDDLDADERDDDSAYAVEQEVSTEKRVRTHRPVRHAPECQRNERHDDHRVEDDG